MKTRKPAAFVLAMLLALSLLAGCGGGGNPKQTRPPETKVPAASNAPATQAPASEAPAAQPTEAPADEGPYHFAKNYATDAEGWPLEKYVYDGPLCDNDVTFTRWTTCYKPQYLPEGGFNAIQTWQDVAKYTGVHIEYNVVDSANRKQNLAVLLASDDLNDIIDQGSYMYSGTTEQALEEGYFADLYQYRHLMPNFMWEIKNRAKNNPDVMDRLFYKKNHLVTLYGLVMTPVPTMGYVLRQDWMDTLNLGSSLDVETFDQMHDVLTAFKVNMSNNQYNQSEIFPFFIYSVGESTPGFGFAGYNTVLYMSKLSYLRVVEDRVQVCGSTDDDKALMTMLNQWYNEGLISPNFQSAVIGSDYDDGHRADQVGAMPQTPGAVSQDERSSKDPNTRWEPVHRTKRYSGQTLQYGNRLGETHYGSANLSAKCENLELACAYMDWWMSDFGGDYTSWGPEGVCWNCNEKGERQLTDWVLNHDAGAMWIMIIYCNNNLVEFCLHDITRSYKYPGGEALHPVVSPVRANMLISLPDSQPVTDSEKLICSELLELGLTRKESESILPAFPYLNAVQSSALNSRILPIARKISEGAINRIDGVSRIMKEYVPEHLADYAVKLPALIQMKEAEAIMRILCESGWLLPMKDCLATTVMMKNK